MDSNEERAFQFCIWSPGTILRITYLFELCEGALWSKHKTQRQSLAKASGASRRAMDVGSRSVQGRALGDAPSSECPHHLILQQPADLE